MNLLRLTRKAIDNPNLAARELNRRYFTARSMVVGGSSAISIFEEDWDNLAILDGCRYDMFERLSTLEGNLSCVRSAASCTLEFLQENTSERRLQDIVYVTANPVYYRSRASICADFHDVINVWKETGWDEERGTVLPETVNRFAKESQERYPNKRLLIHYLQPHYPFVTSSTEFDKKQLHVEPSERGDDEVRFWFRLFEGTLDVEPSTIWDAYESNLEFVLTHIEELSDFLVGKTVISSDHGNMVNERSFPIPIMEWGHPCGIHTPELVRVPWLVLPYSSRKRIIEEEPVEQDDDDLKQETVDRRLNELGYL